MFVRQQMSWYPLVQFPNPTNLAALCIPVPVRLFIEFQEELKEFDVHKAYLWKAVFAKSTKNTS